MGATCTVSPTESVTPLNGYHWQNAPHCEPIVQRVQQLFGRSGAFTIRLETGWNHQGIIQCLRREFANLGISVTTCCLEPKTNPPYGNLENLFKKIKAERQQSVLIVWSLEHLSEEERIRTARWFNASKAKLGQTTEGRSTLVPIILLMNFMIYRESFGPNAPHLTDCVLASPETHLW